MPGEGSHGEPVALDDMMTDIPSVYVIEATPVVVIIREIDMHTASALETVLAEAFTAVRAPSPVVLDLAAVEFLSGAGLTLPVRLHYLVLKQGHPVAGGGGHLAWGVRRHAKGRKTVWAEVNAHPWRHDGAR